MSNKRVCFFSDNMTVVQVIKKQTAKETTIMKLLRKLIVQCLKFNILFVAKHVPGVNNVLSDKLSRLQIMEFHKLARYMDHHSTPYRRRCSNSDVPVQIFSRKCVDSINPKCLQQSETNVHKCFIKVLYRCTIVSNVK